VLGSLGIAELAVIGIILALIFGPSQIPKLGRSIGETVREFRGIGKAMKDEVRDIEKEMRS
jgi:sec-independent protein translocase protein TatA